MKVAIPLLLTMLALVGCAGSSGGSSAPRGATTTTTSLASPATPGPSAVPSVIPSAPPAPPSVTVAELDVMAHRIFPGSHPAGCGELAACPITDRLRARVEQLSHTPPGQPGPVAQFCRCQNGADSMSVTSEVTGAGGIAHVELHYGSTFISKIDLIIVRAPDSRLLLDDTRCTGRGASTSIYAATLAGCST